MNFSLHAPQHDPKNMSGGGKTVRPQGGGGSH